MAAVEHYDKCSLLLPMNGANNGTVFTDWSPLPKNISVTGNTKTSTSESKYYGSSTAFDGIGDYLSGSSVDIVGGHFTISFWFRPVSLSPSTRIFAIGGGFVGYNSTTGIHSLTQIGSGSTLNHQMWNGSSVFSINSTFVLTTTWMHCSVTFDGVTLRLFINGVLESSSTTLPVRPSTTPVWRIGSIPGEASANYNGNIQDFSVWKGVAIWTSDFTPPTRLLGTLSGTVTDVNGDPAARVIHAIPRATPSRLFSTTSSAIDGTYTLTCPAAEVSRIALADEATLYNDIVDRIIVE